MRRGFTLIELLVVIAILAILAGLFFGAYGYVHDVSGRQFTHGRVHTLGCKVEEYRIEKGYVPSTLIEVAAKVDHPGWLENGRFVDYWGRPIAYTVTGRTFRVLSMGADGVPGTPDDIEYERK